MHKPSVCALYTGWLHDKSVPGLLSWEWRPILDTKQSLKLYIAYRCAGVYLLQKSKAKVNLTNIAISHFLEQFVKHGMIENV